MIQPEADPDSRLMASQDMAARDQPAERPVAASPTPDSAPAADSVTGQDSALTLRSDRPLDDSTKPNSNQPPDVATAPPWNEPPDLETPSESDPSSAGEPAATSDPSSVLAQEAESAPSLERAPAERGRWFADTRRLRRHLLAFFLPPLLLSIITAIVVALGSGLLLLGSRELEIGPIAVAWAVVAAALGVLVIGSTALWLATRATH
jgi:hypothetical protein